MNDIRLVIFDWDGTLFNSISTIVESLQFTAQQFNLPLTDEQAKDVIGLALPKVMTTLFPQVPELQDQILKTYIEHNVPHSEQDQWYDGILSLLLELQQAGYMLAVATGKARRGLNRVLERTQSYDFFTITRTADETESKPNPLMLQQMLNELDLQPHQAVLVGDSCYDLDMAQRIKMPSIGVSYGVHSRERLQQFNPISIAADVTQLREQLFHCLRLDQHTSK